MNVSLKKLTDALTRLQTQINALAGGGGGGSGVQSVVAGAGITVDNTDPQHPVVSLTPVPPRYWRIKITANNGSAAYVEVKELEFHATVGGANLCTGGTAFATSSANSSNPPSGAFDGNKSATDSVGSKWASALAPSTTAPQCLGYALPTGSAVLQVALTGCITGDALLAPKDFVVQSSANSTTGMDGTWTDEWSVVGQTAWTGGETRIFNKP